MRPHFPTICGLWRPRWCLRFAAQLPSRSLADGSACCACSRSSVPPLRSVSWLTGSFVGGHGPAERTAQHDLVGVAMNGNRIVVFIKALMVGQRMLLCVYGIKAFQVKEVNVAAVASVTFDYGVVSVAMLVVATTNAGYPSRPSN